MSMSKLFLMFSGIVFVSTYIAYVNILYKQYGGIDNTQKTNIKQFKYKKTLLSFMFGSLFIIGSVNIVNTYFMVNIFKNPLVKNVVTIDAHRGDSKNAPENTIPAFKKAYEKKADTIEIDVRLTKDKELVVVHDENLKRLTGANKNVSQMTLSQIKELDFGSHFSEEFKGEKIPTLKEVIDFSRDKIDLIIELKVFNRNEKEIAKKVVDLLKEEDFLEHAVIHSLNESALYAVKENEKSIKTGYIVAIAIGKFPEDKNIDFYSIEATFVNRSICYDIHLKGKEIKVWTVNDKNIARKLKTYGADSIITDDPYNIRKILNSTPFERGLIDAVIDFGI